MPDSTTEIKGPATEAGRRLLAILGGTADADYQSPTTNAILAIEAEAAAAERAAIRAAFKQGVDAYPNHEARWAQFFLNQVLDARQP